MRRPTASFRLLIAVSPMKAPPVGADRSARDGEAFPGPPVTDLTPPYLRGQSGTTRCPALLPDASSVKFLRRGGLHVRDRLQIRRFPDLPADSGGLAGPCGDLEHRGP